MTWSLTKLKTHEQCGAKYDYKYLQKIKEQQNEFSSRGSDIHSQLEQFIRDGTPLTGRLEFYHGFLSQLKNHPVAIYPEYRIALGLSWQPLPEGNKEEPWFVAYLDLFRRVEVSAQFWDWKTGKIYPGHNDDMELYALAVFGAHPEVEVVTATYVYVDQGKNRERIFSRQADWPRRHSWEARVGLMDSAQPQNLIPNPTFLCRYCSYSSSKGGPCRF